MIVLVENDDDGDGRRDDNAGEGRGAEGDKKKMDEENASGRKMMVTVEDSDDSVSGR